MGQLKMWGSETGCLGHNGYNTMGRDGISIDESTKSSRNALRSFFLRVCLPSSPSQ